MEAIDIRAQIKTEIFDYQTLIDTLKDLSSPRDKITDLLRQEIIIRVKKRIVCIRSEVQDASIFKRASG